MILTNLGEMPMRVNMWNDIEDGLPTIEGKYIVTDGDEIDVASYYQQLGFMHCECCYPLSLEKIIAWKPLPEPYKKENNQ